MRYSKGIAVGTDGSTTALEAVRWAAHTAAIHQTHLDLIYAIDAVSPPLIEYAVPEVYFDGARQVAQTVLQDAKAVALAVDPDLEVHTHIIRDSARGALLGRSRHTSLLVVGNSGSGRVSSALVGSVTGALATHASCPLAVIRGPEWDRPPSGVVTVGVDGSATAQVALDWAAHEAAERAAQLDVVAAWDSSGFDGPDNAFADAYAQIENHLADDVDRIARRLPRVRVTTQVVDDDPVSALVKAAESSDLLVVGSRGRGGFTGLLLGSTSHGLLYATHRPLVIVR